MYKMRKWIVLLCAVCSLLMQTYIVSYAQENADITALQGKTGESEEKTVATDEVEPKETPASTPVQEPFMEQKVIIMCRGTTEQIRWLNKAEGAVITYLPENQELISVTTSGAIKSNGIEGTTVIHATVMQNGSTYEDQVTVQVSGTTSTALSLSTTSIQMGKGDIFQLEPVLVPADATDRILYTVSGSGIVQIDDEGVMQALEYGSDTIFISLDNGATLSVDVRVGIGVSSLKFTHLSGKNITLAKKQSRTIDVTVSPSNASVKDLVWSSEDKTIATVNQKGKITGKKVGTTTITVATTDGSNLQKKIKVTVKKRKTGTHFKESGLRIVSTNHQKYTYNEMKEDIQALSKKYGEILSYKSLGKSWDNRNIYQLTLGNPNAEKVVVVQASIHAREYMTTQLVMKQIEFYCANYYTGTYKGNYYSELFDRVCFRIVPMSNPDGVTISQYGARAIRNTSLRNKLKTICKVFGRGRQSYYTTWKANARGVDLNRNFDARWDILATSVHSASGSGFKGSSAVSEKESKILVELANREKPTAVISYHAMGRILYWNFGQTGSARNKELALLSKIRSETGYRPVVSYSKYQSAGYGDWIAIKKKLPTVTIEIGSVSCPLPQSQFSSVWKQNRQVLAATAELYN